MNLQGELCLVTGAARGLGKAIAMKLAQLGAHLVINDIDSTESEQVVDSIRNQGGTAKRHSYLAARVGGLVAYSAQPACNVGEDFGNR